MSAKPRNRWGPRVVVPVATSAAASPRPNQLWYAPEGAALVAAGVSQYQGYLSALATQALHGSLQGGFIPPPLPQQQQQQQQHWQNQSYLSAFAIQTLHGALQGGFMPPRLPQQQQQPYHHYHHHIHGRAMPFSMPAPPPPPPPLPQQPQQQQPQPQPQQADGGRSGTGGRQRRRQAHAMQRKSLADNFVVAFPLHWQKMGGLCVCRVETAFWLLARVKVSTRMQAKLIPRALFFAEMALPTQTQHKGRSFSHRRGGFVPL